MYSCKPRPPAGFFYVIARLFFVQAARAVVCKRIVGTAGIIRGQVEEVEPIGGGKLLFLPFGGSFEPERFLKVGADA